MAQCGCKSKLLHTSLVGEQQSPLIISALITSTERSACEVSLILTILA